MLHPRIRGPILVLVTLGVILTVPLSGVTHAIPRASASWTGRPAQGAPAVGARKAPLPSAQWASSARAAGPPANISLQDSNYALVNMVYDSINGRFYGSAVLMMGLFVQNPVVLLVTWTPGSSQATTIFVQPWQTPTNTVVDPANGDILIYSPGPTSGRIPVLAVNSTTETVYSPAEVNSSWTGSSGLIPIAYDNVSGVMFMADQLNNGSTAIFALSGSGFLPRATFLINATVGGGVYDPVNGDLYLSGFLPSDFYELADRLPGAQPSINDNDLIVVSTRTDSVVTTYPNIGFGTPLFDPADGDVYFLSGNITVLNSTAGSPVTAVIPCDGCVIGLFDPKTGDVYALAPQGLFVLRPISNQVIGIIVTGGAVQSLAVDSQTGVLYSSEGFNPAVAIYVDYSVEAINPGSFWPTVQFTESGLPPGTSWSVSINGLLRPSNTSEVTCDEPDGNYTFLLPAVPGWIPDVSAGTLTVSGSPMYLDITYRSATAPATGNLVGRILPADAVVYLGSQRLNLTDQGNLSRTNLTVGLYSLRVSAPGYRTYLTNLSITYGNTTRFTIRLISEAPPPVPWTDLTPLAGLLIGGLTGAAAVAVAGETLYFRRRLPPT